jgi:hypothetical protein
MRVRRFGVKEVGLVREAIALHSSPGIAERRGVLARLTSRGIAADSGMDADYMTDGQGEAVHLHHLRLDTATAPRRPSGAAFNCPSPRTAGSIVTPSR